MNDTSICYTNGHTEGNWDELLFTKTSGIVTGDAPVSLSMPLLQFQKSLRMLTCSLVAISTGRGFVPKCVPRLHLRSLLDTRRSAIREIKIHVYAKRQPSNSS